jgi:hypothetical protein
MTEQERIMFTMALLALWHFVQEHPEVHARVEADSVAGRLMVSSHQAAQLLDLPYEVVKAAAQNLEERGLVEGVEDRAPDD